MICGSHVHPDLPGGTAQPGEQAEAHAVSAHTVSFLASEGGFITGQRIIVDGGRSLGN